MKKKDITRSKTFLWHDPHITGKAHTKQGTRGQWGEDYCLDLGFKSGLSSKGELKGL